jgi:nucleoside-diphosphate-sugar epimerase
MRVLITGSAGQIGRNLIKGMKHHQIRGLDRVPTPELEDTLVGDIGDFDIVNQATKDMEAVIHLANVGAEWEQALQSMIGTYNVFESAHQNGVRRIAYASRAGLLPRSFYPRTMQRTMDMLPRPDSYYSVTKVFGENLGYMYTARTDLEVVCVRIGNFNRNRDQPEHPHQLSHGDCVRLFEQAISHPDVKYEVVFGVSDSDWPLYDLEHGRKAIDYHPQDRSEVPEDKRE